MKIDFPLIGYPFHSEGSPAAVQQLQEADADGFSTSVIKIDQQLTPTEQEQLGPNHLQNFLMSLLLLSSFWFGPSLAQFLASEQKKMESSAEEIKITKGNKCKIATGL